MNSLLRVNLSKLWLTPPYQDLLSKSLIEITRGVIRRMLLDFLSQPFLFYWWKCHSCWLDKMTVCWGKMKYNLKKNGLWEVWRGNYRLIMHIGRSGRRTYVVSICTYYQIERLPYVLIFGSNSSHVSWLILKRTLKGPCPVSSCLSWKCRIISTHFSTLKAIKVEWIELIELINIYLIFTSRKSC